jgi:hypothetical protein
VLKLYSGETYKSVSDLGLQILGGYGYCTTASCRVAFPSASSQAKR